MNTDVHTQALRQQLHEVTLALSEVEKSEKTYRFVGGLLVQTDNDTLAAELRAKQESLTTRLASHARHN